MAYIPSKLDADQVIRRAYDEGANRIRVDAEVTASVGDIILDPSTDGVAIGDGVDYLAINPDGSINVNVANISITHVDDSIRLGDGVTLFTSTTVGPKTGLDVNLIALPPGAATETTLGSILTELNLKTEPSDAQNIRLISSATDSISVPGIASETTLNSILTELNLKTEPSDVQNIRLISSATDSIDVPGVASETTLALLNAKLNSLGQKTMANSMPVVLASDQTALNISLADEPIKMSGTENGQAAGPEFTFVNNVRLQILDAKDRDQDITYADFGTKDQRITQIDYTAPSIGVGAGYTARLTINYTLVGTRYRRDSLIWSII